MTVRILRGDCLDVLREMPEASVHCVVTDPPYGLEFMGKEWDTFAPARTQYHGTRADTRKNIGTDDSKPGSRHHVAYAMNRPTFRRCALCGKREFSGSPCRCDAPQWTHEQPDAPTRMLAFQTWATEWAREALRVLKPGGYMVAFGGTRTFHRMACAIEDAGFEIRDTLCWLYGSGFPKSLDVSKAIDKAAGAEREVIRERYTVKRIKPGATVEREGAWGKQEIPYTATDSAPATPEAAAWAGWGTALKPAYEPIILARKPLQGTVAANVLAHGTGALNIDACRVPAQGRPSRGNHSDRPADTATSFDMGSGYALGTTDTGRYPANLLHDGSDEVEAAFAAFGERTSGGLQPYREQHCAATSYRLERNKTYTKDADTGSASRFFYCAKADKDDRADSRHPTVKPVALLRWLVRLVTPPGGTVLDPFAGSGTTGEAAMLEGFDALLIERDEQHAADIRHRVDRWSGADLPLLRMAAAD